MNVGLENARLTDQKLYLEYEFEITILRHVIQVKMSKTFSIRQASKA